MCTGSVGFVEGEDCCDGDWMTSITLRKTKSEPERKLTVLNKFDHADFEFEVHLSVSRHVFEILATLGIH